MRITFAILFVLSILFFGTTNTSAQKTDTPYDELPSINKSEKPTYRESYPSWAKKFYEYPANFYEICNEFDNWISTSEVKKSTIIRYFKNWKSAVEPFVLNDGTIVISEKKTLFKENREALLQLRVRKKSVSE